MTLVDWSALDRESQKTLEQHDVSDAFQRGLEAGEARFRWRLLGRLALATAGVVVLVVAAFVLRGIIHDDTVVAEGEDGVPDGTGNVRPALSDLRPDNGSTEGGTRVTIIGTDFADDAAVTFGTTAGLDLRVVSESRIRVTSPPGTGTVDVLVTAGGQSSEVTPDAQFTYVVPPPPEVSGLEPSSGSTSGGTPVTITGTGFTRAPTVTFGEIPAAEVDFESPTTLKVTSPVGEEGTVDVVVTVGEQSSEAGEASQFTYVAPVAPVVQSLKPAQGSVDGGTQVTITGTGFTRDAAVTFGGTAAIQTTFVSATNLRVISPSGDVGPVDVIVETADGESPATEFTYVASAIPTITALQPATGSTSGDTTVTITGTGFAESAVVRFGETPAQEVRFVSGTELGVLSPPGSATVDVTVTILDETSATGAQATYTYVQVPPPVVAGVNPGTGSTNGGEDVTITGEGFTTRATVSFGDSAVTPEDISYVSPGVLEVTTPATADPGVVGVTVTTVDGSSAKAPKATFRYVPPPTVTGLSPTSGALQGGTPVTISGANFTTGATVRFGTQSATVDESSPTELQVTTPAGEGTVQVTVANAYGTSATGEDSEYTYEFVVDRPLVRHLLSSVRP